MSRRWVECVMNVSEGRRREILDSISSAIEDVKETRLLDVSTDSDHHRSVFSFISTPKQIGEACFSAVARAVDLIDLRVHQGVHPRIGAADVVPLIPIEGVSFDECIRIAHQLGSRVSRELGVPVYFYEQAALRPDRRNLAAFRVGLEKLRQAIGTDSFWEPDAGEPRLHPTAGAVAIGVRSALVAFNVYLNTSDPASAREIARRIRERDGGLPAVKALGFFIASRNQAQVSMNLTDFRITSPLDAHRRICMEAARLGLEVGSSELIGLAPREAFPEGVEKELGIENFSSNRLLENRIESLLKVPHGSRAD